MNEIKQFHSGTISTNLILEGLNVKIMTQRPACVKLSTCFSSLDLILNSQSSL